MGLESSACLAKHCQTRPNSDQLCVPELQVLKVTLPCETQLYHLTSLFSVHFSRCVSRSDASETKSRLRRLSLVAPHKSLLKVRTHSKGPTFRSEKLEWSYRKRCAPVLAHDPAYCCHASMRAKPAVAQQILFELIGLEMP